MSVVATHISRVYHEFTREQLPVIANLATRVQSIPGDGWNTTLPGLVSLLAQLRDSVETHAWTEDDLLFPVLVAHEYPTVLETNVSAEELLKLVETLSDGTRRDPQAHRRDRARHRRISRAGQRADGVRGSRPSRRGAHAVAHRGARPRGSLPAAARANARDGEQVGSGGCMSPWVHGSHESVGAMGLPESPAPWPPTHPWTHGPMDL